MKIKYVLMFMLFLLISMNRILNQNMFRVYPKAGPVPEAPGAPLPSEIDILFDWPCLMQEDVRSAVTRTVTKK